MKEVSMKLSDYFKVEKPVYAILKLKPHKSIRNYTSSSLARSISSMYRGIIKRIYIEEKKLVFKPGNYTKCTYYIDIRPGSVNFYFIVPEIYKDMAAQKIKDVWPQCTIEEVEEIDPFSQEATKYQLTYNRPDAFSLEIDKTNNYPLGSILNVLDVMEEGDRIGIFYSFDVYKQVRWRTEYNKTMQELKEGHIIDKQSGGIIVVKFILAAITELIEFTTNIIFEFLGGTKEDKKIKSFLELEGEERYKTISNASKNKKDQIVLKTNIAVFSESKDKPRSKQNGSIVCESFNSIAGDNSLRGKKNKKIALGPGYAVANCKDNIMSIDECSNFLQLPGKSIVEQYAIECIETLETQVAEELRKGYIRLGTNTYKGMETQTYMSTQGELKELGLVLLGPMGAGKTTFIANYVSDVAKAGESAVVLDFVKHCELSRDIKKVVPPEKLVEIDLSKHEMVQGFGFNEVYYNEVENYEQLLDIANMQTQKVLAFIDSINPGAELTSRMRRSLSAACNVVFLQPNTCLRDVVNCIEDHRRRHHFIKLIPEELRGELQDDIFNLMDMDLIGTTKENKGEVVGTKEGKTDFIMDRINLLMEDIKLKRMFNKATEDNINLLEHINSGKIILIKIPEDSFTEEQQKNILATFYVSKIWLACQLRKETTRCHFIIDEVNKAQTTVKLLKPLLTECRKYHLKFVFSLHYLNEAQYIKEALKAAGSSYMLLQGTDQKNFTELEAELEPYTLDDLLNLRQWNSLNLVKVRDGYSTFITKLPPPVTSRENTITTI